MANLKVFLAVAALVTSCQPLKPPGYVEKPPVHDESPPNYAFDYEVRDHDGGSQGHTEVRKGIFAVGGYYSRLPGDSGAQRVAYYADDWGFHPVLVAYGGRGYATRIAFGDKAVATANAAAGGQFGSGSAIRSIGVHVPQTVNPLPDLTQTGAAALAAENPQKPDADELLASVGAPPAPPQPPKPIYAQNTVQTVGVIPVVNAKPSASAVYSGVASSVVLPSAPAVVNPVPTYLPPVVSTPRPPAFVSVAPAVASPVPPLVVTHGAPAIPASPHTPITHVAPITVANVAPAVSVAVHSNTVKSTHFVVPTAPKVVAPVYSIPSSPGTATSYVTSSVSSHTAPAVVTGHRVPAGASYITPTSQIYSAVGNLGTVGGFNQASSVQFNVPPSITIRKPTLEPYFVSSTPAPIGFISEGAHEIKTSGEAVFQGVSSPAISYFSSTPATPTISSVEVETSTVAPAVVTQEKNHIKESSAAAAAAAASALAAASATGSETGFKYQESTGQSEEENYYSQSSQSEEGSTSISSSSFSTSGGTNEAPQEIEANAEQEYSQENFNYGGINLSNKVNEGNTQQEISQNKGYSYNELNEASRETESSAQQGYSENGGYSYERPAIGLSYIPQTGPSHVGIQSGVAIEQNYQFRPIVVPDNYQQTAILYNPGQQQVYQGSPQYAFSGGSSSSSSSSQTSPSRPSSSSNIGATGGSSLGIQGVTSKPQGATSFQSQVDQSHFIQSYPSVSQAENTGNEYNGVGVQEVGIDLEEQRETVTTQRPQFTTEEEYDYPEFNGPIVVAEIPKDVARPEPAYETSTLSPPTPNPTVTPDYSFPTTTQPSPTDYEVTTPTPVTSSEPKTPFYSTFPSKSICRSCQYTGSRTTTPSTTAAIEVTTPSPVTYSEDITTFYAASQDKTSSQSFDTLPTTVEVTTPTPTTSSESVTPFYSTFPADSRCISCQSTRSQPITLLTAPAPDSTTTTLDEELRQVFFPTATASLDTEDRDVETTQAIDVTPKPFSEEDTTSITNKPPTLSVRILENEENLATTTSSSYTEEYSQSTDSREESLSTEKNLEQFSHGPFESGQFFNPFGTAGGHSFTSGGNGNAYPGGGGNQVYTGTGSGRTRYYNSVIGALRGQNSFVNEAQQQNYDSGVEQQNFGSGVEKQNFDSLVQRLNFGIGVEQQNFGSGVEQQNFGSGVEQQNFGSGVEQQNFGSGVEQQNFGSGDQRQNSGSGVEQQNFGSGIEKQNFDSFVQRQNFRSGVEQQNFGSGDQRQNFGSGVDQQNFDSVVQRQNVGSGVEQQNFGSGGQRQNFGSGVEQQSFDVSSGSSGSEGYYQEEQGYRVTSTPATPTQSHSFGVRTLPPSVLYVDRPVAVPIPYAVPQYVPFAVKGSQKGRTGHRTSSSSSESFESSTPSVISVTQITKIRTSGRKTAGRGYVKHILQEESSSEEEEDEGAEVVIKGGSVKVRPGSFRKHQAYARPVARPSAFRAGAEVGSSAEGGGLKYGDRIRIDRPRKLCIEYEGFRAPVVPSHLDYSQSINLR